MINLFILTTKISANDAIAERILANMSFFEAVFIAVILVHFIEEVLFRRVVLQLWVNKGFVVLGVVFSSVLFAWLHGLVPQEILPKWLIFFSIFMLSVGCSYAYLRSGLRGSWLLHASYNATLIIPLYLFS